MIIAAIDQRASRRPGHRAASSGGTVGFVVGEPSRPARDADCAPRRLTAKSGHRPYMNIPPWRSPCRARPVPKTCTACASRPNPACRPMVAASPSRSRPSRPGSMATGRALARPDRWRRAPPADARCEARPPCPVLARWPDPRVPLGPALARRGGAGRVDRRQGPRGREPGPPAAARRRRGAPADRPAARRRGFEWSPDGTRLVVVSTSHGADRRRGRPPPRHRSDAHAGQAAALRLPIHRPPRLHAQRGRLHLRPGRAPVAGRCGDAGRRRRLTDGPVADREPAWSPDGRRIAFSSNRRRDADLVCRSDIHVVDVETRAGDGRSRAGRGRSSRPRPGCPTARSIAALGHRLDGRRGSRNDIWLFAADGSDATPDRRPEPVRRGTT